MSARRPCYKCIHYIHFQRPSPCLACFHKPSHPYWQPEPAKPPKPPATTMPTATTALHTPSNPHSPFQVSPGARWFIYSCALALICGLLLLCQFHFRRYQDSQGQVEALKGRVSQLEKEAAK